MAGNQAVSGVTPFPVYCICGDNDLLAGYEYLMNKYWPEADLQILYWGDKLPETKSGIKRVFYCLGKTCFSEEWSNGLIDFFKDAPNYFAIMLEDYWLIKPVDNQEIVRLSEYLHCGISKLDLYRGVISLPHHVDMFGEQKFLVLAQDCQYRTSLHLNIWAKYYFLKLLRPDISPWEFEMCNPGVINDGARILGTDYCPVDYVNVIRNRVPDRIAMQAIDPRDIQDMKDRRIYVP